MHLLAVTIRLYAYRPAESESAALVSAWLAPRLVRHERIAVSEPVLASVIRIATHPKVFRRQQPTGFAQARTTDAIVTDLVKKHRLGATMCPTPSSRPMPSSSAQRW